MAKQKNNPIRYLKTLFKKNRHFEVGFREKAYLVTAIIEEGSI